MSSDHHPIIIKLDANIMTSSDTRKTFINYNKANWEAFSQEIETEISKINFYTDPLIGERIFRKIINKAAAHHIPGGCFPKVQPNIPQEACSLIKERDKIKYTNPHSPQIPELNHEIGRLIAEHKRNKWREHLTKCNFGTKTLWNTVKKLNNNIVEANNIKIDFGIKTAEDNKTAATLFNHLFNPKLKSSKGNKRRILLRKLK